MIHSVNPNIHSLYKNTNTTFTYYSYKQYHSLCYKINFKTMSFLYSKTMFKVYLTIKTITKTCVFHYFLYNTSKHYGPFASYIILTLSTLKSITCMYLGAKPILYFLSLIPKHIIVT